ncbi:MAG: helix-hairpin-helix domain-containing protein [Saprospiraceae bacterium]|nr:helix-hairpin-helix domain-containing protein [Saprospiraceae bacterium]
MMEPLKNFFHYTRSERNGAVVLLFLCIALALAPRLIPLFQPAPTIDFSEEEVLAEMLPPVDSEQEDAGSPGTLPAQLFEFDPNTATKEELMQLGLRERVAGAIVNYRSKGGKFKKAEDFQKIYTLSEEDYRRLTPYIRIAGSESPRSVATEPQVFLLFPFDPNTANEAELRTLGLPENVARAILRFREKGGKYRKKEDLQKIYTLSEAQYRRIEPYITIEETATPTPSYTATERPASYEKSESVVIDINQATQEEWQKLRGIGPGYSGRIIKRRDELGGFSSVEQVAETWGLPDSVFQSIRLQLRPSPVLRTIPINAATAEALAAHPYIRQRRIAEAIVSYRNNHGPFRSADDLRKLQVLKPETVEKLLPYVAFD